MGKSLVSCFFLTHGVDNKSLRSLSRHGLRVKKTLFSRHNQLRKKLKKCIDIVDEYVKNDSMRDIICS